MAKTIKLLVGIMLAVTTVVLCFGSSILPKNTNIDLEDLVNALNQQGNGDSLVERDHTDEAITSMSDFALLIQGLSENAAHWSEGAPMAFDPQYESMTWQINDLLSHDATRTTLERSLTMYFTPKAMFYTIKANYHSDKATLKDMPIDMDLYLTNNMFLIKVRKFSAIPQDPSEKSIFFPENYLNCWIEIENSSTLSGITRVNSSNLGLAKAYANAFNNLGEAGFQKIGNSYKLKEDYMETFFHSLYTAAGEPISSGMSVSGSATADLGEKTAPRLYLDYDLYQNGVSIHATQEEIFFNINNTSIPSFDPSSALRSSNLNFDFGLLF